MPWNWIAIVALVKIALLLGGVMTGAAYAVLLERWIAAWVQDRLGPNRVGIPLTKIRLFGLGQPMADGLKVIFKEDYTPSHVDRALYIAAPIAILIAALAAFAVIPFGSVLPDFTLFGHQFQEPGFSEPIQLVIAPGMDVGLVYVFAVSSIAVYGVILGGWSSNNKYSFLGALRSSAQLIAYEIPLGLGILGIVLYSGTLRLDKIIEDQATSGVWNAFLQPLGMLVFVVAAFAEAARLPFDLPETEQELVGGYHTEYASMKLLLFLVAEYVHMITASFLIVILFLGGWHFWGLTGSAEKVDWLTAIIRIVVLSVKVVGLIAFFMLVRWSWPRFRFDQLMSLAWKVIAPLGFVNLVAVAVLTEYQVDLATMALAGWGVLIVACVVAALAAPASVDNRPVMHPTLWDSEFELTD